MFINITSETDRLERMKNAIAKDHHSRSAYIGRITQTEKVCVWDENGQPFEREITFHISWDSISQLLDLISKRAGIS